MGGSQPLHIHPVLIKQSTYTEDDYRPLAPPENFQSGRGSSIVIPFTGAAAPPVLDGLK